MNNTSSFLKTNAWSIVLLTFSLFTLFTEFRFDRVNLVDLEVYYKTALRMLQGLELYRVPGDGHYVYKYSPTAAMFFIPLAIIEFVYAKYLYWIIITAVIFFCFNLVFQLLEINHGWVKNNIFITFCFAAFATHFYLELRLGQVNAVLLLMYILFYQKYLKNKSNSASLLLASSLFIKPFGLIFFPYLLLKKNYIVLAKSTVLIVLFALLPSLLYPSFDEIVHLYSGWANELLIEMNNKQALLGYNNHTVFSVIARYTPIKYLLIDYNIERIYQLMVLAALGLYVLHILRKEKGSLYTFTSFSLLLAYIPLIAATNSNAYIFCMPLFMLLVFNVKKLLLINKSLLILAGLLIGGNIYDVVGKELHVLINQLSILVIGAIILIYLVYKTTLNTKS